jgi:outer membrane receptor protein involved in Fe transport
VSYARIAAAAVLAFTSLPSIASEWQHEVTPYLWASGMDGAVTIGPVRADVDVGFDEITDDLEMGFMGSYRASRAGWSITVDAMYMGLGAVGTSDRGLASADVDVDQTSVETSVGYAITENLTLIGGLRYVDIAAEVTTAVLGRGTTVSASHAWVDPLVGFIAAVPVGERWSFSLRTDVGGFGIGSELAWQVALAARYELTDTVTLIGALRRIDTHYEASGFDYDVAASGPGLGIAMRF